MMEHNY